MTIDYSHLRSEREKLFQQCMNVDSFESLLKIEIAIADSIRETERLLKEEENKDLQFHIKRLRLYADGLVWLVLHPHAIRNLAKNADVKKVLLDQGEHFDQVIQSARTHFKRARVPVLITDITNILKIGDIIVVNNTESPTIVETKQHLPIPKHLMQGRGGRQISRAMSVSKYLHNGNAKIYGEDHYSYSIQTSYTSRRNWEVVDKICTAGIRYGWSEIVLSKYEAMWAYTRDHKQRFYSEVKKWNGKDSVVFLGTSLGLMNMSDGLSPPPGIWPISPDTRFALLEEDVILAHLIDSTAFKHTTENNESIRIDQEKGSPIVTLNNKEYPLSRRFVYDVLYSFETVESCMDGLLKFTRQLNEQQLNNLPEVATIKPSIHHVATVTQAKTLVKESVQQEDFVAVSPDLMAKLKNISDFKLGISGKKPKLGDWGYYILMTITELKHLIEKRP